MVKKALMGVWAVCVLFAPRANAAGSDTPYTTAFQIPGTVAASDFDNGGEGVAYHDTTPGNTGGAYRLTDVDLTAASEGGYLVGWIAPSEWLNYSVNVASAGSYLVEARVASSGQGGTFHLEFGGVNVTGALTIPDTGGWQSWTTVSTTVTLPAGSQVMRVVFDTAPSGPVGNLLWVRLTSAAVSTPYSGSPIVLPGTIPAETFDNGGEGVAYHDTTPGNSGGAFRNTDVDLEASSLGAYDVGWIADGEWLRYSVNVATAGSYTLQFHVASPYATGSMHAVIGSVTSSPIAIPNTGGWQNWTVVTVNATLAAGPQALTLVFDTGGFNVADMTAVYNAPTSTPYSGSPIALPGTIHAETFDNGGEGVAYHDTTPGNSGGAFRNTDVDIAASTLGGYLVGWIADGEWLRYSVNVATAGSYTLQFHVASPYATGSMHAVIGSVTSGPIAIPNTGDWQNWTVATVNVTLAAGPQALTLVFDTGGFNVADITAVLNPSVPSPGSPPPTTPPPVVGGAPTSYSATTDRLVRTKPALPTLGAAGSSFTDPAFGSTLVRVTDSNTRPTSVGISFRTPSAGPQMSWSAGANYFYVTSTDGTIVPFAFDATTMTASRVPGPGDGGLTMAFYMEPQFSSTNPNLLYGVSNLGNLRTITSYDFSASAYSTVVDLDTVIPGLSGYVGTIMTGGAPTEDIIVSFGGASQDLHHYLMWSPISNLGGKKILDTLTSTINGAPTSVTLNFHIHAATIDRSGRFVFLTPTGPEQGAPRYASPEYLWDTTTDIVTPLTTGGPDGGPNTLPNGHGAPGFGYGVNHDCCTFTSWDAAQWQFRSLTSPLVTSDMISPVLTPQEVLMSEHATWINSTSANPLVPIIDATFRYGNNTAAWRAWDDEIIAIETDALPSTVWRFAHHRSIVGSEADPTAPYFWYEPRPSVSPDGRWVLFTSNWEKTLGTDVRDGGTARQDVFLLKLQ